MDQLSIARVCHEANRAYCIAIGDMSQQPWEQAEGWQQESALKGVQFIIHNPNAPPSAAHEAWLAEKQAQGWSWGERKDPVAKTHPAFLPYDQLPVEQKAKDHIFRAIVLALTSP